ncbi:hypothetical protein MNL06_06000 [Bartonella krasnovii]|uniref:hypothetical protein n=1 Tax=Bartonella krasnovii TaxID=2267275 RepID=UPI001F4CE927|nr:hypothetical protein [Bartonella krasnovii]UNF45107.1 hypothetical protein MNL06_06000 [Bartonella krasnovii]
MEDLHIVWAFRSYYPFVRVWKGIRGFVGVTVSALWQLLAFCFWGVLLRAFEGSLLIFMTLFHGMELVFLD